MSTSWTTTAGYNHTGDSGFRTARARHGLAQQGGACLDVAALRDDKHRRIRHVDLGRADDDVAEAAQRRIGGPRAVVRGQRDQLREHDAVHRGAHVEVVPAGGVRGVEEGEEAEAAVHGVALLARQRGEEGGERGRVREGGENGGRGGDTLLGAAERRDDLRGRVCEAFCAVPCSSGNSAAKSTLGIAARKGPMRRHMTGRWM